MDVKFTESVSRVFEGAVVLAKKYQHVEFTEYHLLSAFLEKKEGYFNMQTKALPTLAVIGCGDWGKTLSERFMN